MARLSIPLSEIIERIWRDAPPGREATAVNEPAAFAARAIDPARAATLGAQHDKQRKSRAPVKERGRE
jgi:hypothetical protein